MIRQLLWKDAMTVRVLLLTVLVGIFGTTACVLVLLLMMRHDGVLAFLVSFWFLMPYLFAIGAPAILIGYEEAQGSLSWLKTLPMRWQSIADAKILVAVAGLIICWIASWLFMTPLCLLFSENHTLHVSEMIRLGGFALLVYPSLVLLCLSFATAYLFRSPVAGLVAVVPLIGGFICLSALLERLVLIGQLQYYGDLPTPSQRESVTLVVALLGLLCAWCLQRMLAKRRLNGVSGRSSILPLYIRKPDLAYQPGVAFIPGRPSVVTALLWQQRRQCLYLGLLILGMCVIAVLFVLLDLSTSWSIDFWVGTVRLLLAMAAIWLGSLVFYGDNFRNQRHYFAERGVRPNVIWWTRLSVPALLWFLLFVWMLLVHFFASRYSAWDTKGPSPLNEFAKMTILMMLCFAFSQLVSQWTRRPVQAFFAAPVLMFFAYLQLKSCVMFYPGYVWWSMSSVLILLFATWQLTGPWIENKGSNGSYKYGKPRFTELLKKPKVQAGGYVLLALAVPAIAIVSLRVARTPALRSQWRETLLANPVAEPKTYFNGRAIVPSLHLKTFGYSDSDFSERFTDLLNENEKNECLQLLHDEIAAAEIGEDLSIGDILWVLEHTSDMDVELRLAANEVWITWASRIRRGVCEGEFSSRDLMVAETIESRAVTSLLGTLQTNPVVLQDSEEASREMASGINKLLEKIPSADLRRESRRVALVAAWQIYNRQKWVWDRREGQTYVVNPGDLQYEAKNYLGYPIASRYAAIPYERWRADRIVDELTFLLLRDLEGQPVALEGNSAKKSLRLWRELIAPVDYPVSQLPTRPYWTRANDERLEQLKSKVAKLVLSDEDNLSED